MDGKIIGGRYEIRRQIGAGGSARVYLARDLVLKRDVALKILHEEGALDPSFVKRFRREAQSAARLNHPNIVSVYDWGKVDSTYYMVMEAVDGPNLKEDIARRGPLPEAEALSITEQVASALAVAHDKGVIHRDIKPQNILLDEGGRVKVADFGIARATGMTQLTATNVVAGTANYISPEQARGQPVDERSDIYSLGVLLWELLAGRELFDGRSMVEVALRHINDEPQPLRQIRPDVSPLTEAVAAKALAKDPARRYQSAAAMLEALASAREALRQPVAAPESTRAQTEPTAAVNGTPARPRTITRSARPGGGRTSVRSGTASHGWLAALLALVVLIAGGGAFLAAEHGPFASAGTKNATVTTPSRVSDAASRKRRPRRAVTHRAPTSTPTAAPTPAPAPTKIPAASAPPPARSRPTATSTPIPPTVTPLPATPTPPPALPASSSMAANTPQAAVQAFYTLVSHHQFQQAAQLWTASMRSQFPPATDINGRFSNTSRINILELKPLSQTATTATVQVNLLEVIREPKGPHTKQYAGTWNLVRGPNGWLLNSPNFS